jgi:hypothetical protein
MSYWLRNENSGLRGLRWSCENPQGSQAAATRLISKCVWYRVKTVFIFPHILGSQDDIERWDSAQCISAQTQPGYLAENDFQSLTQSLRKGPTLLGGGDDLREGRIGFFPGSMWVRGDPLVHFHNMPGRIVGIEKLSSIVDPAIGHQLGLTLHGASAASDANMGSREFSLNRGNNGVNIR